MNTYIYIYESIYIILCDLGQTGSLVTVPPL